MFRIITESESYREYVLLRNGQGILLRMATPGDVPLVEALMQRVSRQSLQMRFMGGVAQVPRSFIESLCDVLPRERACLLAIVGEGEAQTVVGVGNYVALGVRNTAEVAFLVDDSFQGRGISTLILERLAGIAAGEGFVGFEAEVLFENQAMINVFKDSGFETRQAFEGGSIHVEFPLGGAAALRERTEVRDRIAAANSVTALLKPRTVAVVGASRDPDAVGSMIFRYLIKNNFSGTVYPVNNQAASVNGVRAYPSVDELPESPELVVVAVPAGKVIDVAEQAIKAGAKGLVVVASGFAEAGPEGAALQQKLLDIVRSQGARLVGPNCLGIMNTNPEVRLNASLASSLPPVGRVGFFSHSAALGLVILDYAGERGLGFSTFLSAGNRADISGNDLLQYWEEDAQTDIALLYLETFGNPRRFARIARRITCRKPILCVKSARSRAGRTAARAHIAASTQGDVEVDLLFRQAGVIRANTLEEMFDVAVLLANQPLPTGNRVAIISNSGGVVTICADTCEANGLEVAPSAAISLGPLATAEAYEKAVREVMEREDVDALIAIFACVGDCDPEPVGRAIRRGTIRAERETGVSKPVLLCLMGASGAVELAAPRNARGRAGRHVFPSYRFPESAALALARVVQYAEYRRRPLGRVTWYEDVDAPAARREVTGLLEGAADGVETLWAEGDKALEILALFGIRNSAPPEEVDIPSIEVEVQSNPNFGPLLKLVRPGREAIVRITPLTDTDVGEMVQGIGLTSDCGVEEVLARISLMIEELPWLCGMHVQLYPTRKGGDSCALLMGQSVRLGFCAHKFSVQP